MVAALMLGMERGAEDGMLLRVVSPILALFFLGITVVLLIADLKQPWRFYYLITKPNFRSWLVWGTYILMIYGALATAWLACGWFAGSVPSSLTTATAIFAIGSACYSAFLFAQAKARDLWQSPVFIWHLLVQALIGGAALLIIAGIVFSAGPATILATARVLLAALTVGLAMILIELTLPAISEDFRRAADLISRGELSFRFWVGVVLIGTIVPLILLGTTLRTGGAAPAASAAMLALVGLWTFENLWIEAGQAVPLS
jgi:formate-dependent nitrite reductase membrane component NrfD